MPAALAIDSRLDGQRVVIALTGELDIDTAHKLTDTITTGTRNGARELLIDLRALEFLDSSGLRALVSAEAQAQETGCALVLVRGPSAVQAVFDLTGLTERFAFVD